jgi:hypothetical protein
LFALNAYPSRFPNPYSELPKVLRDVELHNEVLVELQNAFRRRAAAARRELNCHAPINTLPDEIIAEIFGYVVIDCHGVVRTRKKMLRVLLDVASRWSWLAESTARLWSHIEFTPRESSTQLFLQRSKQIPLHIYIPPYQPPIEWSEALRFLRTVLSELPRTRSIEIYCSNINFDQLQSVLSRQAPLLEELRLNSFDATMLGWDVRPPAVDAVELFDRVSPVLRVLELTGMMVSVLSASLTTLILRQIRVSSSNFFAGLEPCRKLQEITLQHFMLDTLTSHTNTVNLPSMRRIHMQNTGVATVCILLRSLITPRGRAFVHLERNETIADLIPTSVATEEFSLTHHIFNTGTLFIRYLTAGSLRLIFDARVFLDVRITMPLVQLATIPLRNLRRLTIASLPARVGPEEIQVLGHLSTLQEIQLSLCAQISEVMNVLFNPLPSERPRKCWPCPSLRTLIIQYCGLDSVSLSEGVERRYRNRLPGVVDLTWLQICGCRIPKEDSIAIERVLGKDRVRIED